MRVQKLSIRGSPFVGVFLKATDKFCLVPDGLIPKDKKTIQNILGVEPIETRIANASIIGVLCIANQNRVCLPSMVEQKEIDALEKTGIKTSVIPTVEAIGNMVSINDHIGLCGNALREETRKTLERELNIPIERVTIAGSDLAGSASILTNKGFVCHPKTRPDEYKILEEKTGLKGNPSSANYGDLFVGNSVTANSFGALVGEHTTGYEMIAIDEALS
ncbi:MAG: translation initiation factor IF-6 [Candidatus Diapherotrites archaeon]|uniref:Translation initiation factor IF-6 n=1 Tax=Candidatus Iainarchaeum sp. TaxID=3101447 RepID=A0A8T4L6T6_9ARCH|nr:translation initiation factor IF-6 [Candidatus Diapherotrites archaeon]